MRILVLNQYFHPDIASTGQLLTELCEDLSKHHEVTVVCGRPSYNPVARSAGRGRIIARDRLGDISVLRTWSTSFSRRRLLGRLSNYASYSLSCLWGALDAPRPDVILTMTDPPLVAVAAAITGAIRRVPFVYVCQDIIPENAVAVGQMKEGAVSRMLSWLNGRLRRRATLIVAIGRDMRDRLTDRGTPPGKIEVIPNWSDGKIIRPLDGPSAFRLQQGWEDRFVVMHSGNIGRAQDLDTLIDAASLLAENERTLIVLIGDGAAKPALQDRVRDLGLRNVVFLPYQPKESLSESLGAADIHVVGWRAGLAGYALPSKVYGIMAAGKPFIAAIEEGSEPALVLEEHGCGIRVEPGDPSALAEAIERATTADLGTMGRAGRGAFESLFERDIATGTYERALRRAASKQAGTRN